VIEEIGAVEYTGHYENNPTKGADPLFDEILPKGKEVSVSIDVD
jgi:hypothetical protein